MLPEFKILLETAAFSICWLFQFETPQVVILKPFFWAKDLPQCFSFRCRQLGFSTMRLPIHGRKATHGR
jgi:hypothetical protein